MNEQEDIELAPIDLEIETTVRRRLREQRAKSRLNMAEEVEGVEGANNVTNAIAMADDNERAIREYAAPMFNELNLGIVKPEIEAPQFELKPAMFQMLQTQYATEKPMSKPPPPFPQHFQKQQQDGQFRRFLDVLKQQHINITLVEALEQMPNFVKFLKDILAKKRRLGEFETVALTEGCSAILKNKIPPKLKDPGNFTIPISIGG
ncbi:uncharacterized protein LOC133832779 [Humulus lupulus]|uniref:uncharacterized protein LOC133832779 n=1 Tax=Humulus lupulus TaxID=3486 RepID=UPI002B40468C|nr:uncharacterized protein LOC133832779 [Humulus lupulus]